MIATILSFLTALPDLVKLIQALEAHLQEAKTDENVKSSVQTITDAFKTKDATKLDSLFNAE
jgi:hypothetical protein